MQGTQTRKYIFMNSISFNHKSIVCLRCLARTNTDLALKVY